jgi:curved DNA-binding protein
MPTRGSEMTLKQAREVLGVSSASTPEEVRRAFHAAAKRAHPDSGGDEGAFRQVVEAYRRLSDGSAGGLPPETGGPPPQPTLEISPFTALSGGEVSHRTLDGRMLRITLPPGLRSGDKVRAGGCELSIYVRAEGGVLLRGDDLWMTVRVPPGTLRKGGRVTVETPLGRRAIWINRKAAERGLVRLEGQGLPASGRRPRGHLFLRLAVRSSATDSAALALLRRFAAAWAA